MIFVHMDMEYNSQRELLIIPEYGRNVQKLVDHARKITNKEERQAFAEKIVELMMQMHPQNRNLEDQRDKLWKHLFRIASYDLEVDTPNGETPTPEDRVKRPDQVSYPFSEARFRHYGNNVQQLIKKALSMEPGPKRQGFIGVIASYMKLAYRTWNKEHYVSDEVIKGDLKSLSNGELALSDDHGSLDNLSHANNRKRRSNDRDDRRDHRGRDRNNGRSRHHRNSGGRGRRKN